ncbi:hypothetical protein B7463_g11439, partial [Scytalidium lignicola]
MANDTNSCVAACPQGSGTPSDASAYAACEQSCFTSHFFPATPTAGAGAAATTTGNAGSSATTTGSGLEASGSGSATPTGTSTSTSTGTISSPGSAQTGAASRVELAVSAAGLFGMLLAALAL